jgi:membrane protein YqaA with SNARE-associated domain
MSIRALYDWTFRQSGKPHAVWILFFLAMAEASVFPLPADLILLPMCVARRDKAWTFATLCTAGSVIGGLIGYGIGALAMATLGQWIIDTYHMQEAFRRFREGFAEWGVWIIVAKGLTPIPFKLVTIASGIAGLGLIPFTLACIVTRGARYFLVAGLIFKFGEPIRLFIEKYLTAVALVILAFIGIGFWVVLR